MTAPLSFSIVINTLNRASHLRTALASLRYLRYPQYEVIVVNGPSTDDTDAVVAEHDWVRAGSCPLANLSVSRNIGIAMARGDVVCFLDDDAVPEPDWLDRLAEAYRDPKVGGVGGFIRNHTGVKFQCRTVVCDRLGNSRALDKDESPEPYEATPGSWEYISQTGCNSSFRRQALMEIGGFDEEFTYFLDETDVNVRLIDAGWRVKIVPNAEVHHKYAPSHLRDQQNVPKDLFIPLRSRSYFAIKHARGHKSLSEIFAELSRHAVDIFGHNKWYVDNDVVTKERHAELDEGVRKGLLAGISDAFSQSAPAYLSDATMADHADGEFLPCTPVLPATERMRICLLSTDYPPAECGGIGVWTHHLATTLARLGHEVSVITKSHSGSHTVDFEENVWVHRITPTWSPKRNTPPVGDLPQVIKDYTYSAYDEVMRIHLRRGLDVVSGPIWDLEGLATLNSGAFPTVVSLHTTFQLALPHKPDWLQNTSYRENHVNKIIAGEVELLRKAPYALANSQAIIRDLEDANPGLDLAARSSIVPHGLSPVTETPLASTDGKVRLLFVGRLEPRKGADLLLKIAPGLLRDFPDLIIDLVGNDQIEVEGEPLRTTFEREHAGSSLLERISFHGFVSDEEREAFYKQCDLFVAPSRYESFGLIYLEAMRYGKACIGTNAGGIPEVVEDGRTGLLVPPDEAKSLDDAIRTLLADPRQREELGQNALAAFESNFTEDVMAKQVLDFYRQVIADFSRTRAGVLTERHPLNA